MRPVNEVVMLIAGMVAVAVNEAVLRAGAGPLPCGQVWLNAKSQKLAQCRLRPTF